MSTKTNYIGSKLITNIKKVNLLGYFLPSKISDFSYSIETLVKNLNYKFSAYQTMIKYYRENDSKALKH